MLTGVKKLIGRDKEGKKEMIARNQKAGDMRTSNRQQMLIAKNHEDENKAEGEERGGADKGDIEGEGAAQRNENDYPLVEPRLVEAHDSDSSTVVRCTGQVCSPIGPLAVNNPPYTQHLSNDSVSKDKGAGLDDSVQGAGAGLENRSKGAGAGLDEAEQGAGAGLDNSVQGVGTGLDDAVQGGGARLDDTDEDEGRGTGR